MKSLALPSAAVLLFSTAACTHLPAREALADELPAQFTAAPQALNSAAPPAMAAPDLWWAQLNDPRLDALVVEALGVNLDLAQIAARLQAAEASAGSAAAGRYPTLNLQAEHGRSFDATPATRSNNVALAAGYELDLWGRVRANHRAALAQAESTAQEWQAARISLSAQVATQWLRIGNARARLQLIEAERQAYEDILQLIELRFRNGQLSASDVLRQRQLLESTRGQAAGVASELQLLQHGLSALLARPAGDERWEGHAGSALLPLPTLGVPAELVQRRPDVTQQWAALAAADAQLAAAVADRFPQLSLGASYASSDAGVADLFDSWIGKLSATLLGPIVDGGRRRAEVARNEALVAQRLAAYRAAVLKAFAEVQDALAQERYQQQLLDSLTAQLALSDASVERLLRQLRRGGVDYPAVLDAQITNSSLRRQLHSAQLQAQEIRIAIYRSTAGPLPEPTATETEDHS